MNLRLSARAEDLVKTIKEDTGVTQVALLERLVEWFTAQPNTVRMELLDRNGDAAAEIARLKLAEMAAAGATPEKAAPVTIEQALSVARLMLAQIEGIDRAHRRQAGAKKG